MSVASLLELDLDELQCQTYRFVRCKKSECRFVSTVLVYRAAQFK